VHIHHRRSWRAPSRVRGGLYRHSRARRRCSSRHRIHRESVFTPHHAYPRREARPRRAFSRFSRSCLASPTRTRAWRACCKAACSPARLNACACASVSSTTAETVAPDLREGKPWEHALAVNEPRSCLWAFLEGRNAQYVAQRFSRYRRCRAGEAVGFVEPLCVACLINAPQDRA